MTLFAVIAVLCTMLAVTLVVWPLLRSKDRPHPVAATLIALAIPPVVLVTYLLVSNYTWPVAGANSPAGNGSSMAAQASVDEAVASLERKLQEEPGNEEGWILLGSSYLSLQRPADAANAYQRALDLSGGSNAAARLGVAEARIVLDPGSLSGAVGDEIEAVLKAEPANPKALWYGGLLSMARDQPELAKERWQALLALSPPDRVREIIESQLAELDAGVAPGRASGAAAGVLPATTNPGNSGGSTIDVTVTVSAALGTQVSSSAPLFVFVRDSQNPGPPLAVIRRSAGELPITVRITDADIMLPGRSLASVDSATVVARVANGGDPVAKPGDIYGEASWTRSAGAAGIAVVIDRVVGAPTGP